MNDHPAHRGDVVRVHPGVTVGHHDLSGMHLTVQATYTGHTATAVELHPGELAVTEWTGCPPVILRTDDVDVITRRGVA